jgi:hypothetical protein
LRWNLTGERDLLAHLDGNVVATGTWTPPASPDAFYLAFGYGAALATEFYLDALAVDRYRVGLLEAAANSGAYMFEHDIELNGVGFNLATGGSIQKALSSFNPRLGVGAAKYSDLSGFQHYVIPSQHNGIGQPEAADENMSLFELNVDSTAEGLIRLANVVRDNYTTDALAADTYLAGGYTCSATDDAAVLFGLAFGREAPLDSYKCLLSFDGSTITSVEFTCSYGVQDILYNARMCLPASAGRGCNAACVPGA